MPRTLRTAVLLALPGAPVSAHIPPADAGALPAYALAGAGTLILIAALLATLERPKGKR